LSGIEGNIGRVKKNINGYGFEAKPANGSIKLNEEMKQHNR